jgi:hypothetical protein
MFVNILIFKLQLTSHLHAELITAQENTQSTAFCDSFFVHIKKYFFWLSILGPGSCIVTGLVVRYTLTFIFYLSWLLAVHFDG